jgi:hypothetical protein
MKILKYLLWFTFLSIVSTSLSFSQGCSDAGACTINNFKPEIPDSAIQSKNRIKIGITHGAADHSISVIGSYLEYQRNFNDNLSMDLKVTSLAQSGNKISVFGPSDIYVSGNYQFSSQFNATLGGKIPLTKGNKQENNLPLPMDYQSSLGTFDLIFGIGYSIGKLQIVAAMQQPLTQNENEFQKELYPEDSKMQMFQSTNEFQRSGDVLLRISYPVTINDKLTVTTGILPIYHINNDKYTNTKGNEVEIDGSQGLTLNGNMFIDYEVNSGNAFQLSAGIPFIVRDNRPDGMTRSYVLNLEYRIRF